MNDVNESTFSSLDRLQVVFSSLNEMEAQLVVNTLVDLGIVAKMVGQHSAGFRAENPQEVKVVVRSQDAERALTALADSNAKLDIDWDQVDVGNPEDH